MLDSERKNHLHQVLESYIPENNDPISISNDKAIEIMLNMLHDESVTTKDYVLALADGLRYGNWPWTERHTTRALMNFNTLRHFRDCPAYAGNEYPCNCDKSK